MKKTFETIFGFFLAVLLVCALSYVGTSVFNASIGEMTGHGMYFHQMMGILVLLWIMGVVVAHSFTTVFLSRITTLLQDLMTLTSPPVLTKESDKDTTNNNP